MESKARFPRAQAFDSDYWLCRCEGFSVDSPAGRLGFVEGLRFRSRLDRPDALAVRSGLLGRSRLVAVSEVAGIYPSKGVIMLRTAPNGGRASLVRRLRDWRRARAARQVTAGEPT